MIIAKTTMTTMPERCSECHFWLRRAGMEHKSCVITGTACIKNWVRPSWCPLEEQSATKELVITMNENGKDDDEYEDIYMGAGDYIKRKKYRPQPASDCSQLEKAFVVKKGRWGGNIDIWEVRNKHGLLIGHITEFGFKLYDQPVWGTPTDLRQLADLVEETLEGKK